MSTTPANGVRTPGVAAVRGSGLGQTFLTDLRKRLVDRSPETGLPIVDKLSLGDREEMRRAIRGLRLTADRITEALDANRRGHAIEALQLGGDAGTVCSTIASEIGK